MEEYSGSMSYTKAWRSFSVRVTTYHYSCNTITRSLYLFQETAYSFPRRSPNIKHFHVWYWLKVPNIVLYCHQDKSSMRRQHLSVSLSPVPTRINIRGCSEQSLKRDRIYPLHQIEMFRLKYCWDINSGICAKSGIQIRCCFRGKYSGSIWVGEAVKNPEMQWNHCVPH